jgi:hypothetical protein
MWWRTRGTREGKWRGNWRMEWVASTLHTTSEHGVSSITTADAHISASSSRLNWRPRRFKGTRPFRRKTKSGFCACVITFQLASTPHWKILKTVHKNQLCLSTYNQLLILQGSVIFNKAKSVLPISLPWPTLTLPLSSLMNQRHLLQLHWQSSTGRTVKFASLSPLPSVSKQDTSDARSSRPGAANIISVCPYTLAMEKKWAVQSADTGKKLNCRKSHCEKHSKQRKENSRKGPLPVANRPIEPVVKTGRRAVKLPISP